MRKLIQMLLLCLVLAAVEVAVRFFLLKFIVDALMK